MSEGRRSKGIAPGASATLLCAGLDPMRDARRRLSTTEHGHAVSTREYQSDPWSVGRPWRGAPRSPPSWTSDRALTKIAPYQEPDPGVALRCGSEVGRLGWARDSSARLVWDRLGPGFQPGSWSAVGCFLMPFPLCRWTGRSQPHTPGSIRPGCWRVHGARNAGIASSA